MTTRPRTGTGRRRALAVLLGATMLLAAMPGMAQAAAFIVLINTQDGSNWSWPAMAQTFKASGGAINSVDLLLHRKSTDTANFRVEIRSATGGVPSGYTASSSGIVLASQSVSPAGISTDSAAPTTVTVNFTHPAVVGASTDLAIVVLRGTNSGLAWHASTPDGTDQYAEGAGHFCVRGDCWNGESPSGAVDFVSSASITSSLMNSKPRVSIVAPRGPTRATTFSYTMYFDKPVSGLTAGDFTKTGTADNCSLGAPSTTDAGSTWKMTVTGCTAGTLRLTMRVDAVAAVGEPGVRGPAVATPAAATLRIDRTRPKVGAPRVTPAVGQLGAGALPVKVTWDQGTDSGGAGVAFYEVARSTDGGATWSLRGKPLLESDTDEVSATGTVVYRVRAVDWAGNRGAWAEGSTLRPRIVNQTSTAARFSSGWTTVNDAAYTGGNARQSDVQGAAARYTFTGRGVGLVMSTDPSLGVVKVYIDGTLVKTVDTSTGKIGDQVVVYGKRLAYGEHVIRIVSSSGVRPNVILDGWVRL